MFLSAIHFFTPFVTGIPMPNNLRARVSDKPVTETFFALKSLQNIFTFKESLESHSPAYCEAHGGHSYLKKKKILNVCSCSLLRFTVAGKHLLLV